MKQEKTIRFVKMGISCIMGIFAFLVPLFSLCSIRGFGEMPDTGYSMLTESIYLGEPYTLWIYYIIKPIVILMLIFAFINILVSLSTGFNIIKKDKTDKTFMIIQYIMIFLYMAFGVFEIILLSSDIEGIDDIMFQTNAYVPFIIATFILLAYFFAPKFVNALQEKESDKEISTEKEKKITFNKKIFNNLKMLKELLDSNILSKVEYENLKNDILSVCYPKKKGENKDLTVTDTKDLI